LKIPHRLPGHALARDTHGGPADPAAVSARLQAPPRTAAALTLRLESQSGLKFSDLSLDTLRFFLAATCR